MDFNDVLETIDRESGSPTDKFAQTAILAAFRWMKEEFRGRNIDEIGYDDIARLLEAWNIALVDTVFTN